MKLNYNLKLLLLPFETEIAILDLPRELLEIENLLWPNQKNG